MGNEMKAGKENREEKTDEGKKRKFQNVGSIELLFVLLSKKS